MQCFPQDYIEGCIYQYHSQMLLHYVCRCVSTLGVVRVPERYQCPPSSHTSQSVSVMYVPAELMMWPVTSPCVASKFSLSMETGGYVTYTCVPPVR